ncbi:outer membrane protein transport protein [Alcaligenes nematophilus]|uniref:Outer membrane protein transport protein n=1 Tax=Alcaligenes nematophilus TaxID=2994643 RepID=A0ABU3MZT4_9BURK|nr:MULTISPECIES: outer membrane protein transport protein [Alcaligenes]MDT8465660.1 outer membrane protein transport protein [Alcaligenes nematophilus]MDT8470467.1 outer membrane protein transport protein [Alcaligenes nematophilus]MDT8506406.1 outer membrane protein transport protein [Alcaligenes nematophilus]MDT8526627.1 outer membrane protein transport protein [Alcaligenes nematophilus]QCP82790.1 fatty acid transporter [Alcaligenes faecalis]
MKKTVVALRTIPALLIPLGMSMGMGQAHAAGFNLLEQNASGLGNAYAGSAAIGDNASTIYFNPAGMTLLPETNFSAGFNAIKPTFKFSDKGSTDPLALTGGASRPATGGSGGDAGKVAAVPNIYLSHQLSPKWWVGLGIGVPFGLTTEYDEGWVGRYHSEKFAIETINVNPSVAYKVNDQLSFGVGVNWLHIDADYRLATPVGYHPALGPLDMDTRVKMKGDAWGWNAGLLYQITPSTRLGVSYRSQIKITADGDTKLRNRNVPAGIPAPNINWDAEATIKLPDTAIVSLVHDLNSRWQLLADVSWTGWSSIPRLTIENSGPGAKDSGLELKFKDAWRVALGANYHYNEQWTFKGGIAWDQSPVRDKNYRPTALPDSDRYWVSLGAQYRASKNATWDIGYTHLFLKNTDMNNNTDLKGRGLTRGTYKNSGDILGVQFSYRF